MTTKLDRLQLKIAVSIIVSRGLHDDFGDKYKTLTWTLDYLLILFGRLMAFTAAYLQFHTYHARLPEMYSEVFSAHEDMFNVNSGEYYLLTAVNTAIFRGWISGSNIWWKGWNQKSRRSYNTQGLERTRSTTTYFCLCGVSPKTPNLSSEIPFIHHFVWCCQT